MGEMMKAATAFDVPEVRMSVKDQKRLVELLEKRKQSSTRTKSDRDALAKVNEEIVELLENSRRKD